MGFILRGDMTTVIRKRNKYKVNKLRYEDTYSKLGQLHWKYYLYYYVSLIPKDIINIPNFILF